MRFSRQNKILEIIQNKEIDTQEKLAEELYNAGFKTTQTTVSRDIRELGLVKVPGTNGRNHYVRGQASASDSEKYGNILRQTVIDVKAAENLIVIHTMSGCANAAAEIIDRIASQDVIGSIAGDNTIFVAVDSKENVPKVMDLIKEAIS